jgi:hypothetical protein
VGCFPGFVRVLFVADYYDRPYRKTIAISECLNDDWATEVRGSRHSVIAVVSVVGLRESRKVFEAMSAKMRMYSTHQGRIEDDGVFVDG